MTPDGGETGYWDKSQKSWVHLGGKYSDEIDSALKLPINKHHQISLIFRFKE
ncbi:MAG: hypothetical protein CM15mP126_0400 [Gammaproteobacteria bacterium]|nr:MAG: hypothetical protein CM15mP126_0400 [Gammaproteobacteria bacterium]